MDGQDTGIANCPFCPFSDSDSQFVYEHIDFCHPEGGIPPDDGHESQRQDELLHDNQTPTPDDEEDYTEKYVDCPHGCGEIVANSELPSHMDLHLAEEIALDDSGIAQTDPRNTDENIQKFDELLEDKYVPPQKGRGRKEFTQRAAPQKKNRSRSPPYTAPADGVRRLGVCLLFILSISFHL